VVRWTTANKAGPDTYRVQPLAVKDGMQLVDHADEDDDEERGHQVCRMLLPLGWRCTRGAGHDGPCAAVAYPDDVEIVERAMQRLRETPTPDAQKGCE